MDDLLLTRSVTARTRQSLANAARTLDLLDGGAKPRRSFPFADLIRAQTERPGAPFAGELGKYRHGSRGVLVPALTTRDLTTSTGTGTPQSGNLLGSARLEVATALGQPSIVIAAGARVINVTEPVGIPAITGAMTSAWVAENSAPSQAAPVFALRTATPATLASFIDVSRRILLQTGEGIDAMLETDLRRQNARGVDAAALGVGGGNVPVGICGTAGINSVSLGSSGALTRTRIQEMIETVAADGGVDFSSSLAFAMPTAVARKLATTEQASGNGFLLEWDGRGPTARVCGMTAFVTDGVPAQRIIFGDFSRLSIISLGEAEVMLDPRPSAAGNLRMTIFSDVAVVVDQPSAFCAASGVAV
jgi:HK97 family phage major capsid protein